jgi:cation diffusion facilitator CzcD-associated flavoprotein CzcO
VKRGSRLWLKSGRGFHVANDQRVADLTNRPTQDSPEAVVIGAGPAGLAVARELDHQHGIKALVLDRAAAPPISWRASIMTAAGRGRCAAREPNRRCNRFYQ